MATATRAPGRPLRIMLVAGEPSGDALGAPLMVALKSLAGREVAFAGVGGPLMAAEGLRSLFPIDDLAILGIFEVLPSIAKVFRRLRETREEAERFRPDVIVTIDAPGFNHRLASRLKPLGIPLIHYVAPQVWAWRPRRAKQYARLFDRLLTLLPFEAQYFEPEGLPCTFVGHPAIERARADIDGAAFRGRHRIADNAVVLSILAGSRVGEVRRHLPTFAAAVDMLAEQFPGLHIVTPTVAMTEATVAAELAGWRVPVTLVSEPAEKFEALAASDAALAVSGTVTLELALMGVPTVITYKVNALSAALARRFLRVANVGLVNVVLGETLAPELLQENCRADLIASTVAGLLRDPEARARFAAARARLVEHLGAGREAPSRAAARAVLAEIGAIEEMNDG